MTWKYPTAREDGTCETLHHTQVADPYRWMEDPDNEETKAFVEAQNAITMPYLEGCPVREAFHEKITDLFNYPKQGCPFKRGEKFYYSRNSGLQNQSVVYQQDSPTSEGTVFLDPNKLSEDGTVAVGSKSFSEDGQLMAYSISVSGSDWKTIKFMRTDTKEELVDTLNNVKFSCMTWTHDNKGLFYNRYQEAGRSDLGIETDTNINQKLYYHRIGTPQAEDILVMEFPEEPTWMSGVGISDCGQFLELTISKGCEPVNKLWIASLDSDLGLAPGHSLKFSKVFDTFDSEYEVVCNDSSVFYIKTNSGAKKYRIIKLDINEPEKVTEVLGERESVLEWIAPVRSDLFVCCYLEDCVNKLFVYDLSGTLRQQLSIPPGSVEGFSGRRKDDFIYFKCSSFINPGVIYHVDMTDRDVKEYTASVFQETPIKGFVSDEYETEQVFFDSKDGTRVPMFITHKKGITLDGSHPTLMYGYGGFNIPLTPSYSVSKMMLVHHLGGIYVLVNLRGGGEYGDEWHHGGSLANKQKVFDDFIAAGEALVSKGYTSPKKLAIEGGSNGGLLVAACANQRPDLFQAVVCHVGVLDMYRFHKFTIGHAWCTEFGNPEEEEHFGWIRKYSPLHTIPEQGTYPSTLLLTGDHDDRVVPLHSLKFIATLQKKLGSHTESPLLIRVDTKSGHGAGKPTSKRLQEVSDVMAFVARQLGAEWTP